MPANCSRTRATDGPHGKFRRPGRRGESETESERRKRKSPETLSYQRMAKKYLIETFGCQMNVHDSERMAGLLDQAGYEATTDDERRRRDRHQHVQRARACRGEALHAPRRAARPREGNRAPAGHRRCWLRRATGRSVAPQEIHRRHDRRGHRNAATEDAARARRSGGGFLTAVGRHLGDGRCDVSAGHHAPD